MTQSPRRGRWLLRLGFATALLGLLFVPALLSGDPPSDSKQEATAPTKAPPAPGPAECSVDGPAPATFDASDPDLKQGEKQPVSHCNNCVSSFCSRYGVRCTWTGECCAGTGQAHKNCQYTCACDSSCTTVTSPSNVCITDPGPECCVLCQTTWCKFQDLKCTATCTGGCCTYSNCVEEACNAEPCPPNACPGTCP